MPLTLHSSSGGASNTPAREPETVDQFVGQGIGVAAGIGVEEQQLQQLVVREGVRRAQKFGFQTLAVSVVGAHG